MLMERIDILLSSDSVENSSRGQSASHINITHCRCELQVTERFTLFSVKYERIKFLVIALKSSVEIYAWAPKPYHKFMAFKVSLYLYYFLYGSAS